MFTFKKNGARLLTAALAIGLTLGGGGGASAASSGSFNVLSYNVGGLPAALSSSADPATYTPIIGSKLYRYSLVNVQEDFNYHASLYANDTHAYRSSTSGGAGIGSGLNFMSDYRIADLQRVTWNLRHGLLDDGADEMTPKGFTYAQTEIADGVYVDVYNLHADADTDAESEAARRDNLSQLATYIEANSQGHAVLVFGDTNSRYTRTEDNLKSLFVDRLGMKDVWIEKVRGGSYPAMGEDALLGTPGSTAPNNEVVDKIFYRSGAAVTLTPNSYKVEDTYFTDTSGKQLSDHYAISADFTYKTVDSLAYSKIVGGSGGTAFNDLGQTAPAISRPVSLTLRGASRLDAISMAYANGNVLTHGSTGGTAATLTLGSGEYLTSAVVYVKSYKNTDRIFYLELTTNLGRKLASGTKSGTAYSFTASSDSYISGFLGRAGDGIDKLGLVYKKLPLPSN